MPDCFNPQLKTACQPMRCAVTPDDYLLKIESSLPRGLLWQLDEERIYGKFWRGIADVLAWLQNSLCSAIDEFFPCSAEDLLTRQADIWGYPVECLGYPDDAEELCRWISLITDPCYGNNLWTLRALVDFFELGFVDSVEEVIEIKPDCAQAGCAMPGCSTASADIDPCGLGESGCMESGCQPVYLESPGCNSGDCRIEITVSAGYSPALKGLDVGCCANAGDLLCSAVYPPELTCMVANYYPANVPVYVVQNGEYSLISPAQSRCEE